MNRQFMVYIEWDPESKSYVGIVPGLRGAHSCADTLDELMVNMKEVIELVLEDNTLSLDEMPNFVGKQMISVSI